MAEIDLATQKFLEKNGFKDANIKHLPGDASNRSYARVMKNNLKVMLMIAPPDEENNVGDFIKVDEILRNAGLNAPEIFARDEKDRFILLEDFGDDLFTRILQEGRADEREIYGAAEKLLDFLPKPDGLLPYSEEQMLKESVTFIDWYATEADREEFLGIWKRLITKLDQSKNRLVLLDYHADNLMWMPGRKGLKKIGLLDFQDAVIGHPAYDLVSLLQDARRDVDKSIAADILKDKSKEFVRDYYILGAQRNCKIVGYFHRLNKRDGKDRYLEYLPRVWDHLHEDLECPALSELKEFMIKHNCYPREVGISG